MSEKMINHEETRNKLISIAEAVISRSEAIALYRKTKSELINTNTYGEEYI